MNNNIFKPLLLFLLVIICVGIFIKILPFLLTIATTVILVALIWGFVEVNSGRKTVPEVKEFFREKIQSAVQYVKSLINN